MIDQTISNESPQPNDLQIEKLVIGGILYSPDDIPGEVLKLEDEDFHSKSTRSIFSAIYSLIIDSQVPTPSIVRSTLSKNKSNIPPIYLDELLDPYLSVEATTANLDRYAFELRNLRLRREQISSGQSLIVEAQSEEWTPPPCYLQKEDNFPEDLDPKAYYGILGEITHKLSIKSEASKIGIFSQLLCFSGSYIGSRPKVKTARDLYGNLFICLIGDSAIGRKGTALHPVRKLFSEIDKDWSKNRVFSGLSTGEGLIACVRDDQELNEKIKSSNSVKYQKVIRPGVSDKRALFIESEFASVLHHMKREGNTLSAILRAAWDCDPLQTATKNDPQIATNTHLSIVTHITSEEIRKTLSALDMANGFGNRFLYFAVKRSQLLPFGGEIPEESWSDLASRLKKQLIIASKIDEIKWSIKARERWEQIYPTISIQRKGMVGNMANRAEAQIVKIALILTALEGQIEIQVDCLEAAVLIWNYTEASLAWIYGSSIGNPIVDKILEVGMKKRKLTKKEIHNIGNRNWRKNEIDNALAILEQLHNVNHMKIPTRGKNIEIWIFPTPPIKRK